ALSLVVLMAATLSLRATAAVRRFEFGYDAQHLLRFVRSLGGHRGLPADSAERLFSGLAAGASTVPGVRGVAEESWSRPKGGVVSSDWLGRSPRQIRTVSYRVVSPGYLGTLGIPIVAGRDFEAGDAMSASGVAIVDDSSAKRLWP